MRRNPSSRPSRAALFSASFLLLLGPARATCFYPNGDTADGEHFPCDTTASGGTTCCAKDFGCLSNGLCNDWRYSNWTRLLRGACTDTGFGGACNNVCVDLWPQGDEAVWYCTGGKYCCAVDKSCCDDSSVTKHDLGEPKIVAVAGKSTSISRTATQTTTSTTSSSTATTVLTAPSTSSSNDTLPIAVGVGVALGVLLFLLLLSGCWYLRRKKTSPPQQHISIFVIVSDFRDFVRRRTTPRQSAGYEATNVVHEVPAGDHSRGYEYDDKLGGWTNGGRGSRRNLYEVQGERGVEMSAVGEPMEMDGRNGGRRREV